LPTYRWAQPMLPAHFIYLEFIMTMFCVYCKESIQGRSDKKFCNPRCAQRYKNGRQKMPFVRECLVCKGDVLIAKTGDANRKYCSQKCAKKAYTKGIGIWKELNHEKLGIYHRDRVKKNAEVYKQQARSERKRILQFLGGKCVVCCVENPSWLHVDYIPTNKGDAYRHSRTLKFTFANPHLFRILCANHHYELTLTGKIEGTSIEQ
jgi:hypothetical protein